MNMEDPKQIERPARSINVPPLVLIIVSVALSSGGQLAFKAGLNVIGELQPSLNMMVDLVLNPLILLGLAIYGMSALLWLVALMEADLSFAYPFLSLNYVAIMIAGALLFNEHISPLRILSVGLIIVGLLTIAYSEGEKELVDSEEISEIG